VVAAVPGGLCAIGAIVPVVGTDILAAGDAQGLTDECMLAASGVHNPPGCSLSHDRRGRQEIDRIFFRSDRLD
jgi:hypothetical protein